MLFLAIFESLKYCWKVIACELKSADPYRFQISLVFSAVWFHEQGLNSRSTSSTSFHFTRRQKSLNRPSKIKIHAHTHALARALLTTHNLFPCVLLFPDLAHLSAWMLCVSVSVPISFSLCALVLCIPSPSALQCCSFFFFFSNSFKFFFISDRLGGELKGIGDRGWERTKEPKTLG